MTILRPRRWCLLRDGLPAEYEATPASLHHDDFALSRFVEKAKPVAAGF